MTDFVFGYGSLVEALRCAPTREPRPEGYVADLRGQRRRWRVAMDNSRDIPGYKYYLDPVTGERPAVYVAFVDLEPDPETAVNGVVFPVRAGGLAALDARERNYQREDVTGLLSEPPADGRVWAYLGTESARERFATGPTVVCRSYVEQMRDGFAKLGPGELARFDASTDDPPVELLELERVDLA